MSNLFVSFRFSIAHFRRASFLVCLSLLLNVMFEQGGGMIEKDRLCVMMGTSAVWEISV